MLKRYQSIVGGIFRFVDSTVIGVAWLISYWIRFSLPLLEVTKGWPAFRTYAALTPLVVALWMIVFASMRVYETRRLLRRTDEALLLLKAHGTALLFFIAITYLFSEYRYSRAVMLSFAGLGALFLVSFRLLLRNTLRAMRRRGMNLRHVLVVGEGEALEKLIQRLDRFPELGLRILGVVTHEDSPITQIAGKNVLGHFRALQQILDQSLPDQVLIALPSRHAHELTHLLRRLQDETLDIQFIPDIHEYITLGCRVEDFDGIPIVRMNDSPLSGGWVLLKRVTDICVSALTLLLLSPLFGLISLAVKCTSKGAIFYSQERMGLDGHVFRMLKFRTMPPNAEAQTGAVWAQPNDSRRTIVGTFLRKTSLDELPQFWNVFMGEMSLVGPRPERPVFVAQFKNAIPHYMLRHKVKAGITGWAQINGWRGNTSLDRRIECDLFYIRNWSYMLDLKIILLTFWKGFVHKNAY